MNSNTSQAFGFQTGSISDKQGSLKVKLAHLEVSIDSYLMCFSISSKA